jgi:ABC-type polar amino acid transport system ATPase subunit
MITIENIHKSFGALEVLKGIDLHIDKGEVVSIVGPSGAGKTTLLQIIGTLDRPDEGRVIVDGIDTSLLSAKKLSDFRKAREESANELEAQMAKFKKAKRAVLKLGSKQIWQRSPWKQILTKAMESD